MEKPGRSKFYKEFSEWGDVILIIAVSIGLTGNLGEEYPPYRQSNITDLVAGILFQVALLLVFTLFGLLVRYVLQRWIVDMATRFGIWLGASFGPTMGMMILQASKSFVWGYIAGVITVLLSFTIGYWFIKLCLRRVQVAQSLRPVLTQHDK